MMTKLERYTLILLDAFLAISAVAGGIGLLTGASATSGALLQGSPFGRYLIPGLALLCLVGGSAMLATGLMLRLPDLGAVASGVAGVMIMGFEVIEVLVIGSDPGLARNLQLLYFTLGLLIVLLARTLGGAQRPMTVYRAQQRKVA